LTVYLHRIVHLSLRFCHITDEDAAGVAHGLGNMSRQNWKLLTLNLSGNRIGDHGAMAFATVRITHCSLLLDHGAISGIALQSNIDLIESFLELHY
jgi:hypothetical protein